MLRNRENRGGYRRSDGHLEGRAGAEGHFFARLDLDRFTGRWIPANAGSTIPHSQNSEASDLHLFAFLKVLPDHSSEFFQHFPTLLLGEVMLLRQRIGQLLGGDCGCHGLRSLVHCVPWH